MENDRELQHRGPSEAVQQTRTGALPPSALQQVRLGEWFGTATVIDHELVERPVAPMHNEPQLKIELMDRADKAVRYELGKVAKVPER